eukprot:836009-Prymnesium_polylepis.1
MEKKKYKEYGLYGYSEMAVFWDWLSMHQKDPALFDASETPEAKPEGPERAAFIEDLKAKRKFFGGEQYELSRPVEEKESFNVALKETMDLWYAHQLTSLYMLTKLPEGSQRTTGYDESGWT